MQIIDNSNSACVRFHLLTRFHHLAQSLMARGSQPHSSDMPRLPSPRVTDSPLSPARRMVIKNTESRAPPLGDDSLPSGRATPRA